MHARARRPNDEEIKTGLIDPSAEIDCIPGPLLADQAINRLQIGGRCKCQASDIGAAIQPIWG
jgi:hypothetical protein